MPKHIEAEGGELLIQTSKGYTAIIPKNMAAWVKEHIKSGNHAAVDHYVKGLKEVKHKTKAEDGVKMGPPAKTIAESSTTKIASKTPLELKPNELSFLNTAKGKKRQEAPGFIDFLKKAYNRYSNNGQDRTLLGVASNFIPYYEQFVDVGDIVSGMVSNNKEQINSGILGMAAPIAGKAVLSGMDYVTEKSLGKKIADSMAIARNDIVNMTDAERRNLFIKYHNKGGYSQWIKEGRPDLLK